MRHLLAKALFLFSLFPVFAQTPFTDVTQDAGIRHQFQVFEGMFGGGACVLDFNKDGWEDVFVTGGMNDDILYKNNGNGTFTNVYEQSGLVESRKFVTQGVAAADVNRDGWMDLCITTVTTKGPKQPVPRARNLFFLNNGNGTFREATKEYGLDLLISFSTGASFGDINADGFPDLYIGNYFNDFKGELTYIDDAAIVSSTQTSEDYLLLNKGGTYFEDVYKAYGLTHKGFGFGGVFSDYDNDGDLDIIVNHDFGFKRTPNLVLENQYPDETFTNVAPKLKMDLQINSMGTAIGDVNDDGRLDYYYTNIRFNKMLVNKGLDKPFADETQSLGMMYHAISWGANFADFDHDGDVDLFVANGDLNPNCVPMADFYFENTGGKFQEKARAMGLNDYGIGRGSVVFDYDHDGDLDILVVNQKPVLDYPVESFTHLYRNDAAKGNWLKIVLKGIQAESQGLGSRIEVVANGKHMIREIDGGSSSYISQNSPIAHFGLGKAIQADSIIVTWIGGKKQILTRQKANRLLTITEVPEQKANTTYLYLLAGLGVIALAFIGWKTRKRLA